MPRIALSLPALLLGAVIGCKDQYGNLAPSLTVSPVSAGCPANPTVTVFDDTTLRAALKAAKPGDVSSNTFRARAGERCSCWFAQGALTTYPRLSLLDRH